MLYKVDCIASLTFSYQAYPPSSTTYWTCTRLTSTNNFWDLLGLISRDSRPPYHLTLMFSYLALPPPVGLPYCCLHLLRPKNWPNNSHIYVGWTPSPPPLTSSYLASPDGLPPPASSSTHWALGPAQFHLTTPPTYNQPPKSGRLCTSSTSYTSGWALSACPRWVPRQDCRWRTRWEVWCLYLWRFCLFCDIDPSTVASQILFPRMNWKYSQTH